MSAAALAIVRVAGLALVQAAPRIGWMHHGVPPGGPLVPEWLARANMAVGNAGGEAAIELVGAMTFVARGRDLAIATEDGAVVRLREGQSTTVEGKKGRRVRYVAVGGGIAVPSVAGGRGSLLVAGMGGFEGRGLRRGDEVMLGDDVDVGDDVRVEVRIDVAPVRVVVGPDEHRFAPGAFAALFEAEHAISSSSDRVGTRLEGPALDRLDRDEARSAPMVPGAIQVPVSGAPIVLGPDGPTTGGYPVIAVILRRDLGRFHATPLGATVRFARAL